MKGQDEEDEGERDRGTRRAISEIAVLVAEVRKINPTAEDTLAKYIRLVGEMGDAYLKMFNDLTKALSQSHADQRFTYQLLLELMVINGTINTDVVRAQQDGQTRRAGIQSAEKVAAGVVEKIDPQLVNDMLRRIADFFKTNGEGS